MSNLNISIATVPGAKLDIHRDIALIKTGLLYGDKIKLFSLTSPILMFMYLSGKFDKNTRDQIVRKIVSDLCNKEFDLAFEVIDMIKKKKRRTPDELKKLMKAQQMINNGADELFEQFAKIAQGTGVECIVPALERNLIEIDISNNFDFASDDFVKRYVSNLMEETLSGNSFPMYDKQITDLLSLLMKQVRMPISDSYQEQIKHIASVHSALSTLPKFDNATIQDIIGVRDELDKYLARFRAAMLAYSKKNKTMPWDKDFHNEISLLFLAEIAPQIEEICSIVEQNSYLRKLCTNFLNDKALTITGLANLSAVVLPLEQAIELPAKVIAGVSALKVLGKNFQNTYNEYVASRQRAVENSFFFYYKAGKLLGK